MLSPSSLFERIIITLPDHERKPIRIVTDLMDLCKVWLQENDLSYTTKDLVKMTKLIIKEQKRLNGGR